MVLVFTFHRLQVVYCEFEALSTPHHPHCVPLIIIEARTRKDGLWAFTCTQPRALTRQRQTETHRHSSREREGDTVEDR